MNAIKDAISNRVSAYNRKRKLNYFLKYINNDDSIIDIGVFPIDKEPESYETNYIEEYFLKINRNITVLGLEGEDYTFFTERYKNCKLLLFDGKNFPENKKYDVAISTAVIEHVGDYKTQLNWLCGVSQICNKLIITTPNKWFPVEVHTRLLFLHWFDKNIRHKLYRIFRINPDKYFYSIEDVNLLTKKEFIGLLQRAGFSVANIKENRILLFTMDFTAFALSRSNSNII